MSETNIYPVILGSIPRLSLSKIPVVEVVALFCVLFGIRLLTRPSNTKSLPGPWCPPYFGPLYAIDFTKAWLQFHAWSLKHGPIYQVTMFGTPWVWVSDTRICQQLLAERAKIYSDRIALHNVNQTKDANEFLPLLRFAEPHHRQRKFETRALLEAKNNNYFGCITLEAQRMLVQFLQNNEGDDYGTLFEDFASSIACTLSYGFPHRAAEFAKNANDLIHNLSPAGAVANIFRPLSLLPAWLLASKRIEKKRHTAEWALFSNMMQLAKNRINSGVTAPSQALSYFQKDGSKDIDDKEATYVLGAFPTISIITITSPLRAFVLAMVLHPSWQDAAQKEIDRVCGDRMPELSDSPNLPVLRAIIKETLRWRPTTPLGVPHELEEDDVWEGYTLKKGSLVFAGDFSLCRNPETYPSPDAFHPDRWLVPSYPTYREPLTEFPSIKGHHGFGYGRRVCVGQDLVHAETLVACGAMLWAFKMTRKTGSNGRPLPIDDEACTPYLISMPIVHPVEFKVRSGDRSRQIMANWQNTLETQKQEHENR